MKQRSLVHQLIFGVLMAELLCAIILSWTAVAHEAHGRRHGFEVMLRGRADSVLGAVQDAEDPEDNVYVDPSELSVPAQDAYEVLSPTGRVIGHSPTSSPELLAALSESATPGYFNFKVKDTHYGAIRMNAMRIIDRNEDKGGLRRPVTIIYASPTRQLWHEAVEAVQFYLISGVLLLALTGLALIWFLRRRLSPLQELAAIAGRVSTRSWDFAPPDDVLRTTELAPIAHSIDELLKGLRRAFERERQLTGDAAHELKTSIAVLKSSMQLLTLNPRTAEQYEIGLAGLLTDTERMEVLTSRMLALARLQEATPEPNLSSNLPTILRSVAQRQRPIADLRQIQLDISAEEPYSVNIPSDDAEVLCSNLLLNALEHSRPHSCVSANISARNGSIELRVEDQGEGIPEAALPHVFDRFYRADRSRSRNSGGAGLGLSICKAIVDRANGSIHIQSAIGQGTEVTVTLPVAHPD